MTRESAGRISRAAGSAIGALARAVPPSIRGAAIAALPRSWAAAVIRQGLKSGYEQVNRTGTLDTALFDPEIEWRPPPTAPTAGVYRGRDEAARELAAWTEPFDDFQWEPREVSYSGDPRQESTWLVAGRMSGRGKGSGVETEIEEFHVWTLRRGRLMRLEMYLDRDEARRAAGLESAARR